MAQKLDPSIKPKVNCESEIKFLSYGDLSDHEMQQYLQQRLNEEKKKILVLQNDIKIHIQRFKWEMQEIQYWKNYYISKIKEIKEKLIKFDQDGSQDCVQSLTKVNQLNNTQEQPFNVPEKSKHLDDKKQIQKKEYESSINPSLKIQQQKEEQNINKFPKSVEKTNVNSQQKSKQGQEKSVQANQQSTVKPEQIIQTDLKNNEGKIIPEVNDQNILQQLMLQLQKKMNERSNLKNQYQNDESINRQEIDKIKILIKKINSKDPQNETNVNEVNKSQSPEKQHQLVNETAPQKTKSEQLNSTSDSSVQEQSGECKQDQRSKITSKIEYFILVTQNLQTQEKPEQNESLEAKQKLKKSEIINASGRSALIECRMKQQQIQILCIDPKNVAITCLINHEQIGQHIKEYQRILYLILEKVQVSNKLSLECFCGRKLKRSEICEPGNRIFFETIMEQQLQQIYDKGNFLKCSNSCCNYRFVPPPKLQNLQTRYYCPMCNEFCSFALTI